LSWLSARPLVGLGVISYGIYLWHLPLLLTARELGLLPATFALRLALVLPLAIGAGALSWIMVESPVMRYAASRQQRTRTRRDRAGRIGGRPRRPQAPRAPAATGPPARTDP